MGSKRVNHDPEFVRIVSERARNLHGKITVLTVRVVPHERRLSEISTAADCAMRRVSAERQS